jgi:hypothetical protein
MLKRGLYWRMKFCSASSASASVSTTRYSMLSMNAVSVPRAEKCEATRLRIDFALPT